MIKRPVMDSLNPSYLQDLQNHLGHSAVVAYSIINGTQISFSTARRESAGWIEGKLDIKNFSNVYFQRFSTGMEREGIRNLDRLKVDTAKGSVAWIDKIKSWTNVFTGEKGVELRFFDGIHLRFTGDVVLSIADEHLNDELNYTVPSKKHESRVKFIKGIGKAPSKIPRVVDDLLTQEQAGDVKSIEEVIEEDTVENVEPRMEIQENQEDTISDLAEVKVGTTEISATLPDDEPPVLSLLEQSKLDESTTTPEEQDHKQEILLDEKFNDTTSIQQINGVTKANKQMLIDNGFNSVSKIADARIPELVKIKGIGRPTAKKLIDSAKHLIGEIGN